MLTFLIAFIYRTAPNTHVPFRQALPLLAALAIEAVTLAFPLYTSLSAEISTLGRWLAALVLLGWLYLVSHILLLGAYFNNRRRLSGPRSAPGGSTVRRLA